MHRQPQKGFLEQENGTKVHRPSDFAMMSIAANKFLVKASIYRSPKTKDGIKVNKGGTSGIESYKIEAQRVRF
jgi:hypothetical protein